MRKHKRSRMAGTLLKFTGVLLVLAGLWGAGFYYFLLQIPGRDFPTADAQRTDAVVVLTGGSRRVENGFDLLLRGRAEKLFISGVDRSVTLEALIDKETLDKSGMRCCIVLGRAAGNTIGNAAETAIWIQSEGYKSLRLVTGNYHMPRSLVEFRAALPDVVILPHPVHPANVRLADWWRWPGTAALLAGEYMKYLAARLRLAAPLR